ncbi:MAG TPA: TIGR03545 family protein [Gemmatimonadales bacterium]|nr:TIGR03545 family protein [Gemmatimonadales bacterium]
MTSPRPQAPRPQAPGPRPKLFRWRAIGPLLVLFVIMAVLWWLFADTIARRETQKVGTQLLGAKVEIADLHLDVRNGKVMIRGLTVASPHEALKNLVQADELVADLDVVPLTEKKLVINRLAANGLRFGTPRETDGRVAAKSDGGEGEGIAARVMAETREWAKQFQVPALQLATGEISIDSLDPRRLATIPAAEALGGRADSTQRAWRAAFDTLRLGPTLDSASATLEKLKRARATDLATLNEARLAIERLKRAEERVTTLERGVRTGLANLQAGVAGLDSARRRDYAFARSLLKLPSLDAPEIGTALFAPGAIKPFERVLYYAQLARRYMPPGLLPRATTGPQRVRRSGEDVRFPKERALPRFLLRTAELSFLLNPTAAQPQRYAGRLTGLTSDPALYGRPTLAGATGPQFSAGALVNHVRAIPHDTAGATIGGIRLPALEVPGLSLRLDPGAGTTQLGFDLNGDTIHARFALRSSNVRWARDSGFGNTTITNLLWQTLSGISTLELEARLSGALHRPALSVRSNLDQVIASRLRSVLGEQVAAAERQLRVRVDSLVNDKVAPVRARVTELQTQAQTQVAQQRARIDELQKQLEQELRNLTRGIRLP